MEATATTTLTDRFWLKSYPEGVAHDIDPDRYSSILDLFYESVSKYPNHAAFINLDVTITYKELDVLSNNFASYLQNVAGMKQGDRIAIQLPNLLQFPVALFGALKAGLIVVCTNPLYTPHEMKHQFNDSGATALVILENFAVNLQEILPQTPIKHVIVSRIGDMLGTLKGALVNTVVKYVKKMVPAYSLPKAISLKDALSQGSKHTYKPVVLKNTDIALLQYTGGTTGLSKGAALTHRNITANMVQLDAWVGTYFREGKEVIMTALPLYHIFALSANCLAMFKIGGTNILVTNPRDMPAFIKVLQKYPMTIFTGVNTLFVGLMNQPAFRALDFSQLRLSLGGGMAVQESVAKEWKELTGTDLIEAYGLSETSPGLVANPIDGRHRLGYIGLPLPSTYIRIVDDAGNDVPLGERGEIWAKGPQVMQGYWNQEVETSYVFHDGWFKTGDIGIMDTEGFIKIVDRKKEMILVSGFNVYPTEIEAVIASHPKVLEAGVIGVPDAKTTETVKAFVIKKDESLTEDELMKHCRENLTPYKCPKYIVFRKELPKSNVGKILRRMLKEENEKA